MALLFSGSEVFSASDHRNENRDEGVEQQNGVQVEGLSFPLHQTPEIGLVASESESQCAKCKDQVYDKGANNQVHDENQKRQGCQRS
jgi:hypothetical protein